MMCLLKHFFIRVNIFNEHNIHSISDLFQIWKLRVRWIQKNWYAFKPDNHWHKIINMQDHNIFASTNIFSYPRQSDFHITKKLFLGFMVVTARGECNLIRAAFRKGAPVFFVHFRHNGENYEVLLNWQPLLKKQTAVCHLECYHTNSDSNMEVEEIVKFNLKPT